MNKIQTETCHALKQLGHEIKEAENRHTSLFEKLKETCAHRKPYRSAPHMIMCSKIKRMWHVWPCKMEECPLLKGDS